MLKGIDISHPEYKHRRAYVKDACDDEGMNSGHGCVAQLGIPTLIPLEGEKDMPTEHEGGAKHDTSKTRYDLVPVEAIEEIARVLTFGSQKYGDRNWEKGIKYGRVFAACMRHLWAWWGGEEKDKESGLHHLAHAGCCVFFLLAYTARGLRDFDDREGAADSQE